ncbi:MAG: SRPBCC family protein [Betaproteobacteria bacterium]|jgi:carbon monoxide dehydrogenase subunit G|nr:SRPBCC family protein [Betaproteobacteria bacterium]MBK6601915.1 SRPBCC family protein [Betaproteobacteria bacterium]MBK7591909.1 SRPBCC family protein [Betaproteobacteria bacterium]MBK8690150.1 SRPBCC family protein [Betaproteobacteria bacterium]MBK9673958.1 SRPBCC family protein [Betaproteobacteria bacterium]
MTSTPVVSQSTPIVLPELVTLAAALALASLVAVATPADAATISIGVQRRGDRIDIEASAQLDADGATAWRVLADYERYVDFIPDLRVSRVSARRGATVIVEQSGDATLWLLRLPLDVTFEITEIAPTRLRSRAIAGSFPTLESDYRLTPTGSGVRLEYQGRVATGWALFGPLEQLAVERNIARQFQALADAIEQRSAGDVTRRRIDAPNPRDD